MTTLEKIGTIGAIVAVWEKGFSWHAKVFDIKEAYGNVRYLVEPVAGSGQIWIDASRTERVER